MTTVVGGLPGDLPVPVLVVLHLSPDHPSHLGHILSRAGPLPAAPANDGEALEAGRIYVAPPDCHLMLEEGEARLYGGPRENGHRPAVDPLFRSAAAVFGPRVVAVVLSGARDDGTAGLAAIKRAGGLALVQDPEDAAVATMPRSAIAQVEVDQVLPVAEIARAIVAGIDALDTKGVRLMAAADDPTDPVSTTAEPADATGLTCPECGGALWQIEDGGIRRYRCHVGHLFSEESLNEEQGEALEHALWTAVRALEERAALMRRGTERFRDAGRTAARFAAQADAYEDAAQRIRSIITTRPAVEAHGG